MSGKPVGQEVVWAVVAILVGIGVIALGVALHNTYVAFVGIAVALAPLLALFARR